MRLHFEKSGSGYPLLILHGLFGSSDNWAGIAARCQEFAEVWRLDLRNHGRSEHSSDMTLQLMADDVRQFVKEHRLERPDMLGHSLGGKVAMRLALDHCDLLRKLVVVDISPREYEPRHRLILTALQSFHPQDYRERSQIEALLEKDIPDLAVRRFLLKSLVRDTSGTFRWRLNLPGIATNFDHLNEAVEAPTPCQRPALLVRGGRSDYVTDADWALFQKLFPVATLCAIPEADHWVHTTGTERFVACLRDFLAG